MRTKQCSSRGLPTGFSLVETIVLLALSAVLTGIVVSAIAAMYRYNATANLQADRQMAAQQMMTILRRDIHQTSRSVWDNHQESLTLELFDQSVVTYRIEQGRWVKVLQAAGSASTTTSLGLDSNFHCLCTHPEITAGDLLQLSFINQNATPALEQQSTARTVRFAIDAIVGRDRLLRN